MSQSNRNKRAGFTLLEVMIVVAILVALATVGVVGITGALRSNNKKIAAQLVNDTERAVKMYQMSMGSVPETDEGLEALVTAPDDEEEAEDWTEGGGPYLENGEIPEDPWGNPLAYAKQDVEEGQAGQGFVVYSFGPNGVDDEGSEDDIPNWAEQD
jgi:general secretion pathway protein G